MKQIIIILMFSQSIIGFGITAAWPNNISMNQKVHAGTMAQYPMEIHNDTDTEHRYQLNATGLPDSIATTFSMGGSVVKTIVIPANSYLQLTLRIEIPPKTVEGHYNGQFSAIREDGEKLSSGFSLNVENTYDVNITSQPTNLQTFIGQEFSFDVEATNTGASPVTHLSLKVVAPAKWIVQLAPQLIGNLDPGESIIYKAKVLVPPSQVSMDQSLELSLTSDQISSSKSEIMVRVQKSPGSLIPFGVIALLTIIGALIYFRMKGRR